jgi:hypothetical protein
MPPEWWGNGSVVLFDSSFLGHSSRPAPHPTKVSLPATPGNKVRRYPIYMPSALGTLPMHRQSVQSCEPAPAAASGWLASSIWPLHSHSCKIDASSRRTMSMTASHGAASPPTASPPAISPVGAVTLLIASSTNRRVVCQERLHCARGVLDPWAYVLGVGGPTSNTSHAPGTCMPEPL